MLLSVHPDNPSSRKIRQVVEVLTSGGVIIYPTDTVYALGCDILQNKAVERICRIRGLNPRKVNLSIICQNISQLSDYAQQLDNQVFKLLKRNSPGPFTFIFKSSHLLPKLLKNKRKTIGIRIPDHPIPQAIIQTLDRPILSISLKSEDEVVEYFTDPTEIYEDYAKLVDLVIDGGIGGNIPSTIVDCSVDPFIIQRDGVLPLQF
ncbi:MAG: L-threonylcarbamoyladenylate synthase [Bacteroidota bacterium]